MRLEVSQTSHRMSELSCSFPSCSKAVALFWTRSPAVLVLSDCNVGISRREGNNALYTAITEQLSVLNILITQIQATLLPTVG